MHCHPAKTQLGLFFFFHAKKKKWTFCRYRFTWQVKVSKTTRCVHVQTQTPKQHSLNWNSNNTELANIQTYLVISPSTPLPPSFLSLSLFLVLQRQPISCAAAHYAGWWLSPCQLTVQLAYLRLAQTLILAGERTVYTYWCPHSYALACTSLIVKQRWHMRGEGLCKLSNHRAQSIIQMLAKRSLLYINPKSFFWG